MLYAKCRWGSVLAALVAALAGPVFAAPITFGFAGTVTDDPFELSSFGAPVTGSFTFDSAATDSIANPANGSFASVGAAFGFSVDVDGTMYSASGSLTINTANDLIVGDQYGAIAIGSGLSLEVFLQDATGTALSSDALPLVSPLLTAYASRQFRLFSGDAEFLGTIDTLECTAGCSVPEPGSLFLMALALSALGLAGRRRNRIHSRLLSFSASMEAPCCTRRAAFVPP